ncbi:MAG: OmpH family outer membrane protein [Alphaproteobacteria bacterium]
MTLQHVRMRIFVITLFIVIFGVSVTFKAHTACAQTTIAVVDVEAVLSLSKAAESIKNQVDDKRQAFLEDVKNEEEKLREEQKAIEKQRADMSKEELLEKAQNFERRRLAARKKLETKKAALDKSYSIAMTKLTEAVTAVCQDIANETEIDLIITRQNIVIGSKSLDITPEVMSMLDQRLPSLDLE